MVRGGITTLPVIWRWRLAFAVLAAICAAWLLFGPKPWDIAREIDKVRAAGKLLKTRHYVIPIFYWVAAGNFILSWLLLAGARWWSRPLPPSEASALPAAPRRWWMAIGLVILLGLALRVPLSTRSLWWDELWQTKFTATGYFLGKPEDPPASRHLAEGSWERAFWYYSRPTNHPVASVPARFCHLLWKALSHPSGPLEYNNLVLRLPTLFVCALTFLALALLGRALGLPWVGILAALLLALHPWHIRYGVDVRSYAYLMLSVTGGLLACARLSSGASSWRPWALLGVSQFAMVWSWFLAAAVAAPLALVSLGLVWLRWRGADRRVACGRWLLVHVLAGMAFLQIMGPNLVQTREYVSKKDLQQDGGQRISRARVLDLATVCLLGLPGDSATETFPGHAGFPPPVALTSFATEFRAKPLLMGTAALVIGLALLTGMVAAFRTRIGLAFGALLVAALLLAALFTIMGSFFYSRFFIFLLPASVLLIAWGTLWWGRRLPLRAGPVLAGLVVLGCFCLSSLTRIHELLTLPMAPLDAVTGVWREAIGAPFGQPPIRPVIPVAYGHGLEPAEVIIPEMRQALSKADLETQEAEARRTGARLLVALGHRSLNAVNLLDGVSHLEESGKYRALTAFSGIEPDFYFRIFEFQAEGSAPP